MHIHKHTWGVAIATGAGYNDAFKYLQDDIEKYRQPCDERHAEPDSIVFLDMAKIMAAQAKQNQQ